MLKVFKINESNKDQQRRKKWLKSIDPRLNDEDLNGFWKATAIDGVIVWCSPEFNPTINIPFLKDDLVDWSDRYSLSYSLTTRYAVIRD